MPTHIMTAFPVMGGDPMLTSGAVVTGHTSRGWHFGHRRRWWHIRWRRSRRHLRRGWRWCGLLLRARSQADNRQSDKCVENRGFHDDQSLTKSEQRKRSGFGSSQPPVYPSVERLSSIDQPMVALKARLRHARHTRAPHKLPLRRHASAGLLSLRSAAILPRLKEGQHILRPDF